MSTPNDLQALLASIRPRPSPPNAAGQDNSQPLRSAQYQPPLFPPYPHQQPYDGQSSPHSQPHGYLHPSVSSTVQSPSPANTPPHHGSDILSPNVPAPLAEQPQQSNNPDRAANLLNLLKFSQNPPASQPQAPVTGPEQPRSPQGQEAAPSHERNISASDLVASLFSKQAPAAPAVTPPVVPGGSQPRQSSINNADPAENTQDMLLRLLNRPKPGPDAEEAPALVAVQAPAEANDQPVKETLLEVVEPTPQEPAKPETVVSPSSREPLFNYVNPFDQLAAASPRKKSPLPEAGGESPAVEVMKQKVNASATVEPTLAPESAATEERSQSPILDDEQREAVNEVVGRLVDEIGRSLSGESKSATGAKAALPTARAEPSEVFSSIASHLGETAAEAKEAAAVIQPEEPEKQPMADAPEAPAGQSGNEAAEGLADSWESAEDSAEKEEERVVSVHNFPLRPFISITVKTQPGTLATFRDDGIMDIARLKKEFDQLDRSLTAATSDYIVYALAKSGGVRVIRQDDGSDKQVFRSTRDRVFNVTLCTSMGPYNNPDVQAILGIGVSGTVYWTLISRYGRDFFEEDALESESLIFPPFPAFDENTSGGQLKTRAKRSTRHSDLFAIGRGKNIYVVNPQAAASPRYGISGTQRTVNTEKFLKERALTISTGKAGKDFAFSDDDTVIASLDKTGRLRFWDINDVVDNPFVAGPEASEIHVPLHTFVTGSPTEKSWPTSVLFMDKLRAYSRSMALRYVLVGLKQNHTLQLWDIGLGKAVQELKFPHENESDAICSVVYHPPSGIIVVGHPTRNSIYFVHLSAPRYTLAQMSQAAYIRTASKKDSSLPKPESTACLSGIREISLGSKGQLRSLEILSINKSSRATEEVALFELYVMHSRGVTCLNIRKEDLGWTSDNKVIRPVDALEEGFIEIGDLQSFPSFVADESVNGDAESTLSRSTTKEPVKSTDIAGASVAGIAPSRNASPTKQAKKKAAEEQAEFGPTPSGSEKHEKKKKKKAAAAEADAKPKEPTATAGVEPLPVSETQAKEQMKANETLSSTAAANATQATERGAPPGLVSSVPRSGPSNEALSKHLETLQSSVSSEFTKSLGHEFESLYRRFDDERRRWDAASAAKQDQVLRLVSSTLSENVEKNLARIVSNSIQSDVVPAITDATSAALGKQLDNIASQKLNVITDELRQALPKAVANALQQPPVTKVVVDTVVQKLASRVEAEVSKTVHNSMAPVIEGLMRSTKKIEADMERHFQAQIKHYEAQRQSDHAKLEEMSTMLRNLSNTVATLAAQGPQDEAGTRPSAGRPKENVPQQQPAPRGLSVSALSPAPRSPDDAELADIAHLINSEQFEEGSIKVGVPA